MSIAAGQRRRGQRIKPPANGNGGLGTNSGMSRLGKSESPWSRLPRIPLMAAGVLAAALLAGVLALDHYWPFRESAVASELSAALSAKVRFGSFRTQYFPPGCVAENVRFERPGVGGPWMTVRRLTIASGLGRLVESHVRLIRAQGVHLRLTRQDLGTPLGAGRREPIDRLIAEDAVVEIAAAAARPPQRFLFHNLRLEDLVATRPVRFWAALEIPLPQGLLQIAGEFGPRNGSQPGETPISGQYSLENADLGALHFLRGRISSTGRFQGRTHSLDVTGSVHSPLLAVASSGHGLPLDSQFRASVNTSSGDVFLEQVRAQFGHDQLDAHGSIARGADRKRAARIELECRQGRIEDTFYPFIHSPRAPLAGNTHFTMGVRIPGGREAFLTRIEVESDFRIDDAHFTRSQIEARVTKLATKQQEGEQQQPAASFHGRVTAAGGVAHFSELSVQDSGASGRFRGTYGLLSKRVDLHGELTTENSLAETTHGIKAVFAKVLDPFFKKNPRQHQVPVKIDGTYAHPGFGLDLGASSGAGM